MSEFPDEAADWLQTYIDENHEFLSWLGTSIDELDEGYMRMVVPYDRKLTNRRPDGGGEEPLEMHGGVAATLIDTAGGLALRTALDDPVSGGVATINLNVNYLRRATADLVAEAEVVRAGGSVGVSHVSVESEGPNGERRPVATGQGAYRLFRR